MTLKETVVVSVVLGVLAAVVIGVPRKARSEAFKIKCVSNLKQAEVGLRLWAGDHGEKLPWQVSTNLGGTHELAATTNLWLHWHAARREVESPKILNCAMDTARPANTRFDEPNPKPTSYAVNFDAMLGASNSPLVMDRNLIKDRVPVRGGWTTISNGSRLGWDTDIHRRAGNIAFGDGSVRQTDSRVAQEVFRKSPVTTNRLLIP